MKPIKMFGLAALAALMALAFVGVSSALAETTALCGEPFEAECAEPLEHVHEETLSGAKAKLLSSVFNIECDVLFLGDTLNGGVGSPLIIHGTFTYSNCNNNCTATEENGPAEIKVLREGAELAKVTGEGLVHTVCSGFINCRYNHVGLTWHSLGALTSSETNGSTLLSEQTMNKESGSFCPSTAKLDITTTPLEPLYLGGGELKMVCIKLKEKTGLYLSSGNGQTCSSDSPEKVGSYELAEVLPNLGTGEMACGLVTKGFYLDYGNGKECQVEDNERKGIYELGTVS